MSKEESVTIHESRDQNGQLQSVIRYKIPKEKLNGCVLIPKWLVGLGSIMSVAVLTTIIASVVVIHNAPRAALYQENCSGRSCTKDLGLICKNKTCDCPTGYIYINKCIARKTYMEQCHLNSYCQDNTN